MMKRGEHADLRLSICLGLLLVCLGPLAPNHYPPWPAFYAEAVAVLGLGVLSLSWCARPTLQRWPLSGLVVVALATVPILQASAGLIYFWGDAWLASGYLLVLAMSIAIGASLNKENQAGLATVAALCVLTTAIVSIGIATTQWLRLDVLGIFAADLPPGGRPFANFGQPNQLATWLVLATVCTLLLFHLGRLGRSSFALIAIFLCWGIAMTQSRTAWLELALVVASVIFFKRRLGLRVQTWMLILFTVLTAAFSLAWPYMNDALLIGVGRSLQEQTSGGTRLQHWGSVVDAISQRPVFGYGWNQVSVAQAHAGVAHAAKEGVIEYSHDIVLDLLVWNGLPLGAFLIAAFCVWARIQIKRCATPANFLALLGIGVILVHGLLEYPLAYTYFLIPMGLLIGAVDRTQWRSATTRARSVANGFLVLSSFALLTWIGFDYLRVEDDNRALRFEMARIGTPEPREPSSLLLLTQQRAFFRFARSRATRDMTPDQLSWMQKISERFGYPPVLLRYATAAGLNGQIAEAEGAMDRLCRIHPPLRCAEGLDAWQAMTIGQYPELARVRLPLPPSPSELRGGSRPQ